jgi:hypothetical protein
VNDLARMVGEAGGKMGLKVEVQNVPNPRVSCLDSSFFCTYWRTALYENAHTYTYALLKD